MKLVETTASETSVRMRYADDADPAKAKQWIEAAVPIDGLAHPRAPEEPLGLSSISFLGEAQLAVLLHVRATVAAEIQRMDTLLDSQN
jgi:hypothetical protein